MKAQVTMPTYILAYLFIIIIFVFGVYTIFATNLRIKVGLITATEGMQGLAILNKLVSDPDCLSSEGRIGILDAEKIKRVDTEKEHPCAQLPNFGYEIIIQTSGKEHLWTFGQKGIAVPGARSLLVAVRDGEKTYPATILINTYYESGENGDMLLRARTLVEQAWDAMGSYERAFSIGNYDIDFEEGRICYSDDETGEKEPYCRSYVNPDVKVELDAGGKKHFEFRDLSICRLNAMKDNGVVKVSQTCILRL